MAHDYHLAANLRERIELLDAEDKRELAACLDELLNDPEPDDVTRVPAPPYFPYRPGAITMNCGKFRINYQIANRGLVVDIFAISPLPSLA